MGVVHLITTVSIPVLTTLGSLMHKGGVLTSTMEQNKISIKPEVAIVNEPTGNEGAY